MKREFWEKRGWILFNQSSQSPTFNVHDMCIFPMLSKAVSREQALLFCSTLLKGEQLYETVTKVWHDKSNLCAIARAFASHWQVVLAAMHHKGDNDYLKEKGGLTFGIRKMFVQNESGDGIIPVTLAPEHEGSTLTGNLLNQNAAKRLKYDVPSVTTLDKAKMTREMIVVLDSFMDKSKMSEEHRVVWEYHKQLVEGSGDDSGGESDDDDCVVAEIVNNGSSVSDSGEETETDLEESDGSVTLGGVRFSESFDTVVEDSSE